MAQFNVEAARNAGYSDQQIQQFMKANNLTAKKSLGGFGRNIVRSTGQLIGDTISGVANIFNPNLENNTVANIGKLALGLVETVIPGEQGQEQYARALGQYLTDRYGSLENIKETLYNDPAGFVDDVSLVLTAGGSAITKLDDASRIGRVASRLGETGDITRMAGRGLGKGVSGAVNALPVDDVPSLLRTASERLNLNSLRPSPTQQARFADIAGEPIQTVMREKGIFGSGDQVQKMANELLQPIAEKYNSLTRTGEIIDPTDFIDKLRREAENIKATDFSLESQSVADNLLKRADSMETQALQYMIDNNTSGVPIDILTNTKSGAFSKVPGSAMIDSGAFHSGKIAGGKGIEALEELAPGSAELGKSQQIMREMANIGRSQAGKGKGTQLFNLFKPAAFGAGYGLLAGGAGGAAAGAVINAAINDPRVQGKVASGLNTAANVIENADIKIPDQVRAAGNIGKNAVQPIRAFERISQESQPEEEQVQFQSLEEQQRKATPNTQKKRLLEPFSRRQSLFTPFSR